MLAKLASSDHWKRVVKNHPETQKPRNARLSSFGGPSRTRTLTWGGSMGWLKQVPIAPRRNRKF